MKLLLCLHCADVIKLASTHERRCACGSSKGRYEPDGWNAWVAGPAEVIGIGNFCIPEALRGETPEERNIKAWIFKRGSEGAARIEYRD